ncbi:hypothetical protein HDV63DRAFT_334294 [Trichoderma sp. SZMC 28014]
MRLSLNAGIRLAPGGWFSLERGLDLYRAALCSASTTVYCPIQALLAPLLVLSCQCHLKPPLTVVLSYSRYTRGRRGTPPLTSTRCVGFAIWRALLGAVIANCKLPTTFFPISPKQLHHTWSLAFVPFLNPTALRLHLSLSLSCPVQTVLSQAQKTVIRPALSIFASLTRPHIPSGEAFRAAFPASELDVPGASVPHPLVLHGQLFLGHALRPKRLDSWMVGLMFIACHHPRSALSTCRQTLRH